MPKSDKTRWFRKRKDKKEKEKEKKTIISKESNEELDAYKKKCQTVEEIVSHFFKPIAF